MAGNDIFLRVPARKKPERHFNVGDKIRVNMHAGKIIDAIVRAVVHDEDRVNYRSISGTSKRRS